MAAERLANLCCGHVACQNEVARLTAEAVNAYRLGVIAADEDGS